jgi:DeoR family transcriptional regulator, glycerol-3-phosphate regulon repressor
MDAQTKVPITERQARIVEIVSQQGFATIENLAKDFCVSPQSVRRDIIRLDEDGLLQRFHGGVGLRETSVRMGYAEKRTIAADAKKRIAETTASLVTEGSVVFLDVGTTVEAVAHALTEKRNLRVFTVSLAAAGILAGHPGIDVFVLGGAVRGIDGSIVGETTLSMLARFRFDFAIIGFSGLDSDGTPMDYDLEKVAVKQAAVDQSACALIVGDSSKFRKSAVVRFANGSKSVVFVTETSPPITMLEKLSGRVVVAEEV